MRLRQARADEWELAATIRNDFVAEVRGVDVGGLPAGFADDQTGWIREAMAAGTYVAWLMEVGDDVVGSVALAVNELPPLPGDERSVEAWVIAMWVDAAHRRRGIAAELLAEAEAHARSIGARRLLLWATDDGYPLYVREGFSSPDTLMSKDLTRAPHDP